MITSVQRTTTYDYELADWQAAHLLRPSWVRAKLATLDPALMRHHPGRLSDTDLGPKPTLVSPAANSPDL